MDENFRDAYYKRGLLLGALGDVDGATQDMNRAIRHNPMLLNPQSSAPPESNPIETTATVVTEFSDSGTELSKILETDNVSVEEAEEVPLSQDLESSVDGETELSKILEIDDVSVQELDEASLSQDLESSIEEETELSKILEIDDVPTEKTYQSSLSQDLESSVPSLDDVELSNSIDALIHEKPQQPLPWQERVEEPRDNFDGASHEPDSSEEEALDDSLLDPTLILNRPSAALVENLNRPSEEPARASVESETFFTELGRPSETQSETSIPEDFNAFSRQTWVQSEEEDSGPTPTYFSDLVLEPCTHEGNDPGNRFCIHCGQAIHPTLGNNPNQ